MQEIVLVTSTAPSIVVIRETYDRFFSTEEKEVITRYVGEAFLTVEPRPTFLTATAVDDWLKFQALLSEWRSQRGVVSSITEAALCPAYQGIIGMGPIAVSFILTELQSEGDEPDQWFWALKAITGADPVQDQDRGDFVAMAKAWIQWAKNNGYAW